MYSSNLPCGRTTFYHQQQSWGKVIFSEVCVNSSVQGDPGGAWLLPWGAWLLLGGHAWDATRYGDMINERAVRILLECILVCEEILY